MNAESVEAVIRRLEVGLEEANQRPKIAIAPAAFDLLGDYADAVSRAGGEPIVIPRDERGLALLSSCNGLLITGVGITTGYDVPESLWTDEPQDGWKWLDNNQHPINQHLIKQSEWLMGIVIWAMRRRFPTIGAGLGAQLLIVAAGGKLLRHTDGHEQADAYRPRGVQRRIEMVPGSWLTEAWGDQVEDEPVPTSAEVICSHHMAPDPEALPENVRVVAWTNDEVSARRYEEGRFAGPITDDTEEQVSIQVPHAWELLDKEGVAWGFGLQFEPQHSEDPEGFGNLLLRWFVGQLD